RRHTRWPRDWSSDVCSSDLHQLAIVEIAGVTPGRIAADASGLGRRRDARQDVPPGATPITSHLTDDFLERGLDAIVGYPGLRQRSEERRVGTEWCWRVEASL